MLEIGRRRVGKESRYWRDWSSDVCSSDLRFPEKRKARERGATVDLRAREPFQTRRQRRRGAPRSLQVGGQSREQHALPLSGIARLQLVVELTVVHARDRKTSCRERE